MRLPFSIRWKLLRQEVYAALGFQGNQRVQIADGPAGARILVGSEVIHVPSPLRWKLYRWGWDTRLDRLAREYGVGRHVTLGPDSTVLDIGANAGEFAHVAARHGARVFCCEPDPSLQGCLRLNVDTLDGVSRHDIALWKDDGTLEFGLAPERADSSVFTDSAKKITVRAQSIDSFCTEHSIDRIDLIKCDAEGAEPEVLQGLNVMASKTRVIALDTGPERKGERTHEACAARLSELGFQVVEEKVGTRWMTFGLRTD